MIGVHLYVFGGLNERQETLQDVWLGEVTPDTNQRVVPWTVEWRPVTILSNGPSPRSKHAAAATAGQMYVFGGEGVPVQAGRHVIYSDMWAFSPQNLVWTQVIVPGPSPTGRFGHSMTLIGASKLYVFGGTTANGISTELWQFSPDSQSWRQITQLMSDAIWPSPTTAHAASEFIVIADAATAFVYNNYASNIVALIAQTLPNATMTAVNLAPFRASAAQAALIREDSDLRFLVVFGGYSDVSNMVTGELWLFDTITSTWSAPMMYQPGTDTTTPRRYATMFASADSIFIHGGFLYNQMSTSSIGYLQIRPWTTNTSGVTYSFPWSSWGTAQNGGLNNVLGIPSALSATQWLSLSPISFKAFQPNFKSQDAVALLRVNVSGFASQPPQTVGVTDNRFRRAAHSLTRLGDAVFFFGGMSAQVNSIQPSVNFASASNQLLALAVAPLCTKRQATVALASFPSGFRQTFVASERCFVCSRGSYAKFAANGNVSCVICGPGTYAQSPGTADQVFTLGVCPCFVPRSMRDSHP